ncbi:MAG: TrkA family potassium uptake protein [Ignavibacteriaceae bacterium]
MFKRLTLPLIVLVIILFTGTVGFWYVTGKEYSLFHCFYMTFITITTIGYGEILDVSKYQYGRPFVILIAVSGIGGFTYMITSFTALFVEGEILHTFKKRKETKMIKNLSSHYIVCGYSGVGLQIAEELTLTHRPFVIVEKESTHCKFLESRGYLTLNGDETDEAVLESAGIRKASGLFAVSADDNINLVVTFVARQICPNLRIVSKSNLAKNFDKIKKAGADAVVSPNVIGGLRIVSEMVRPTVVTFLDTMLRDRERSLRVEEVPVSGKSAGKPIKDFEFKSNRNALLIALKRNDNWEFNPEENLILEEKDILIFIISPEERYDLYGKI